MLVFPSTPTVLQDQPSVKIEGHDLWVPDGVRVFVVSGTLDFPKLQTALSRVIARWPHTAGRLQKCNGTWQISLSNSGVPLDVEHRPNETIDDIVVGLHVAQPHLSSILMQTLPPHALPTSDMPLLRIKVVFFRGETTICIGWHHVLGDATAFFRFVHSLSQEYQGLESVHPAPTFEKHTFPSPSHELIDAFLPTLSHLQKIYPRELAISTSNEIGKPLDVVTWRFDKEELAALKDRLNKDRGTADRLTTQDCLTAYIFTVLNRCLDKPMKRVSNVASYRTLDTPFNHPNVAGNQYYMFYSDPIPAGTSAADTAGIIRDSIIKHRDVDYAANWLAVCGHLMLAAQSAGQTYFFSGEEDVLLVNSMAYIDWASVHFGFPDSARFFRPSPPPYRRNHLMIFPANPVSGEDGKWTRGYGALDVMLTVPKSCKSRVVEILREGISSITSREPQSGH